MQYYNIGSYLLQSVEEPYLWRLSAMIGRNASLLNTSDLSSCFAREHPSFHLYV